MSDRKQERFFDQRVVQRNVAAGRITKEEHQAFLAALPDVADNIRPREDGGDDDGYDRPRQSAANDGGRRPFFEHARPLYASSSADDDLDDEDLDDEDLDDDDLDDEDDDEDDEADASDAGEAGKAADAADDDEDDEAEGDAADASPSIDDLFTPPDPKRDDES